MFLWYHRKSLCVCWLFGVQSRAWQISFLGVVGLFPGFFQVRRTPKTPNLSETKTMALRTLKGFQAFSTDHVFAFWKSSKESHRHGRTFHTKSEGTSKDWNDSNHLFVVDSSFKLLKSLQNKSDTSRCSLKKVGQWPRFSSVSQQPKNPVSGATRIPTER